MEKEEQTPEVDISTLDSEGIKQAVEDGKLSVDDVVKYSEDLEAQHKTTIDDKNQTILSDRLKKIEKLNKPEDKPAEEPAEEKADEMDVRDLVFLGKNDLDENSDEAAVYKEYKDAGLIKSYKEGLDHKGVLAELADIKEARTAAHELDGNADEDTVLNTKNEIYDKHLETGKDPSNDYDKKVVVERSLAEDGFTAY